LGYLVTSSSVRRSPDSLGVQVNYSSIGNLVFNAGSGNSDDIAILDTPATMEVTINAGTGNDTVHAGGTIVGNLGLILGPLTVNGQGNTSLTLYDQSTTTDQNFTVTGTAVTRTHGFAVSYSNLQNLTLHGGSGQNTWSVEGTSAGVNTTIYGGTGYNQFGAGDANSNALNGALALHGQPGSVSFVEYWDYVSPTAQTYTLSANTISRPGLAPVSFDGQAEVIFVPANVGGNMINVQSVAAGVLMSLDTAPGDTVTVGANQSLASVLGTVVANNATNVVIDDSADPTPPAGPITFSNDIDYGFGISGLVPPVIYMNAAPNTTVNANLLLGAGNKTISVQAPPQGVALTLDAGSGANTLDYTSYTGNVLVDLSLDTATAFNSINNIENVTGASGGGTGFYNVLIGNGGNVLTGGFGRRSILVAGGSPSTLNAGDNEDLLIGGTTIYDTEASLASWQAIGSYWAGTDDYFTRMSNLMNGNGVPLLDATTVTGNGGGNTINGDGALALIYSDGFDTINGFDPNSQTVPINP
jgi:hypothetical protein